MSKGRPAKIFLPLVGVSYGLFLGASVYVALQMVMQPGTTVLEAVHDARASFWQGDLVLTIHLGVGGLVGLALALSAAGVNRVTRLLNSVAGISLGGLAGLTVYVIGYITATQPVLEGPAVYVAQFRDAALTATTAEALLIVLGAALGLGVAQYSWRFHGVLTYTALFAVVSGYISYTLLVTLPALPPSALPLSIILFVAEAATLVMILIYTFYALDVSSRTKWDREADKVAFSTHYVPKVAFHVATYNEPPELVIETLEHVLAVDYPEDRVVVMVLDDSTDPELRRPLETYCLHNGIRYVHREERSGFKAGALNNALDHTPDDVELIAVLDADYQVRPEYLRETVGYFVDNELGFLQTPQDYRNRWQSFLTERYYHADAFFYRAVLPSRNEENAIIFCGTMGILRRRALEEAGGWGEAFITEDAELSLRILHAGYRSMYVNNTYGRGLIPATYDGYKKQQHRWAFGGMQILRKRFWELISPNLTRRQRFDFLAGSIHWIDGLYLLGIALVIAVIGLGDAIGFPVITHHLWEIWLIGLVPVFLLIDGVTRLHFSMNRELKVRLRDTMGVLGLWYSIKFNNMAAAIKALMGAEMPFVRTPKAPDTRVGRSEAARRALQLTRMEASLALLMLVTMLGVAYRAWAELETVGSVALARVLLIVWLGYHMLIFLAAPYYAYKSYVTFEPELEDGAVETPAVTGPGAAST